MLISNEPFKANSGCSECVGKNVLRCVLLSGPAEAWIKHRLITTSYGFHWAPKQGGKAGPLYYTSRDTLSGI